MTLPQGPVAPATSATGSIYDLGYQSYEGPRLGRRHAVTALFLHSLRGAFGIGRGGRAKIVPIGLALLSIVPAIIAVGIHALVGRATSGANPGLSSPIRYETYYGYVQSLVMLFVAAQAPELLGRDQRYSVLSLYFSRALLRIDYAVAKAGALAVAILIVVLTPQAIIFVGLSLSSSDVPAGIRDNAGSIPAILIVGAGIALLLGSIGVAIAAFTPRRAYATAAIMAVFLVPPAVAAILSKSSTGDFAHYVVLLSPGDVLEGLNAFVFARSATAGVIEWAALPGMLYLGTLLVEAALLLLVLVRRYARIAA